MPNTIRTPTQGSLITLVTGATGTQGGAVARALRRVGRPVRALVRDPLSAEARALQALGAELAPGAFEDDAWLDAALVDVGSVVSATG